MDVSKSIKSQIWVLLIRPDSTSWRNVLLNKGQNLLIRPLVVRVHLQAEIIAAILYHSKQPVTLDNSLFLKQSTIKLGLIDLNDIIDPTYPFSFFLMLKGVSSNEFPAVAVPVCHGFS